MNPEEITLDYLGECYYYCTGPITFENYVNIVSEYMIYQIEHLYPMSADEYKEYAKAREGYVFNSDRIDTGKMLSIQRITSDFIMDELKDAGFSSDEVYMIIGSIHEQALTNLNSPRESPARKTFEVLEFTGKEPVKLNWVRGMFFASYM